LLNLLSRIGSDRPTSSSKRPAPCTVYLTPDHSAARGSVQSCDTEECQDQFLRRAADTAWCWGIRTKNPHHKTPTTRPPPLSERGNE